MPGEPRIPALVTVNEVTEASRLSTGTVYKLMKSGELRSVLICGRRMIFADSYVELLDRLTANKRGNEWGNGPDGEI